MDTLLTIPWFKLDGVTIPGIGLKFHLFGLLVGIALVLGVRLAVMQGQRNGIRKQPIEECALYSVVSGFVLGHVFDVVVYSPDLVLRDPKQLLYVWQNLSSFGGVFGALVGCRLWARLRGVKLLPVYDSLAFAFPFGWTLGRIGCFVVHDHPGKETDFFLAVRDYQFPGLEVATRHDLGLYEAIWSVVVSALFWQLGKKPRAWGFYTGWFAVLYAPFRFGLDFLRVSDRTYFGLTPGHYSSLLTLLVGALVLAYARRHGRTELDDALRLSSATPWPPTRGGAEHKATSAR